jgi:hypothetical protein
MQARHPLRHTLPGRSWEERLQPHPAFLLKGEQQNEIEWHSLGEGTMVSQISVPLLRLGMRNVESNRKKTARLKVLGENETEITAGEMKNL